MFYQLMLNAVLIIAAVINYIKVLCCMPFSANWQ